MTATWGTPGVMTVAVSQTRAETRTVAAAPTARAAESGVEELRLPAHVLELATDGVTEDDGSGDDPGDDFGRRGEGPAMAWAAYGEQSGCEGGRDQIRRGRGMPGVRRELRAPNEVARMAAAPRLDASHSGGRQTKQPSRKRARLQVARQLDVAGSGDAAEEEDRWRSLRWRARGRALRRGAWRWRARSGRRRRRRAGRRRWPGRLRRG